MNKAQESMLEKALQPTWDAKERFYQETKGMTTKEILENWRGEPFLLPSASESPLFPSNFPKGDPLFDFIAQCA
jgi:hypothetical protein